MAKDVWSVKPSIWDILSAWFPYEETPGEPGPKARPSLVLEVLDAVDDPTCIWKVSCAYGTGQGMLRELPETSFLVTPDRLNRLKEDTAFRCARIVVLPYNSVWFADKTPIGKLDKDKYKEALNAALTAARWP